MAVITIETDNRLNIKAIMALCKALGIATVRTSQAAPAAPKRLRKELEARMDAIDNGTALLHTFENIEELKQSLAAKTGTQL